MRRILAAAGIVAAAVSASGCLEKETRHTLYLSPAAEVAWTVFEQHVRSGAAAPASREREEAEYLSAAAAGDGAIAQAFAALEAQRVRTWLLRRERPFTVMTEARFEDVEALADRILGALRIQGDAWTTRENGEVTLHVHLDTRGETQEADSRLLALVEEVAAYRIVLTEGAFTAAEGFTLSDDGSVALAVPIADDDLKGRGVYDLSLSWRQ